MYKQVSYSAGFAFFPKTRQDAKPRENPIEIILPSFSSDYHSRARFIEL